MKKYIKILILPLTLFSCVSFAETNISQDPVVGTYEQKEELDKLKEKQMEREQLKEDILKDIKIASDKIKMENFSVSSKAGGFELFAKTVIYDNYFYPDIPMVSGVSLEGLYISAKGEDKENFTKKFDKMELSYDFTDDSKIKMSVFDEDSLDLSLMISAEGLDGIIKKVEEFNRLQMKGESQSQDLNNLMQEMIVLAQTTVKLKGINLYVKDNGFIEDEMNKKASKMGLTKEEFLNSQIAKIKSNNVLSEVEKGKMISFIKNGEPLSLNLRLKKPMGFMELMMFKVIAQNNPSALKEQFIIEVK